MADLRFNVSAETRQATAALGSFAQSVQKNLVQAVRSLPNIEINADSSDAEREMKRIRDAMADLANKKVGVDIDAADAVAEVDRLQNELQALGGSTTDVSVRANVDTASKALDSIQTQVRGLDGADAEVEVVADTAQAEQKLEGFGDAAKVSLAAAGAGAGAILASAFAQNLEMGEATAKFEAQLGNTGEGAKELGAIAGSLYANAYGESLGEVQQAVLQVVRSGALMEDATNEQIESITGRVMSLAQAFDQDLGATVSAVGQMIKTGMAGSAEEALDILARGFQQGNDRAGDLLDTFVEYGTQFRKLGLDGGTAMGLITQGLQAGARDADIAADALKEFSIRAIDGSDATIEGFRMIGLNAEEMSAKISRGGPEAAAALDLTLDRLRGMKDPTDQAAAAVMLFGTQAEDMGAALYALDVTTAVDGLGRVAGAAEKLDATMGATAQAKVTAMQRGFDGWTQSLIATEGPLGDVSAWLSAFGPAAGTAVAAIAPMALGLKQLAMQRQMLDTAGGVDEIGNAADRSGKKIGGGKAGLIGKIGLIGGALGALALLTTIEVDVVMPTDDWWASERKRTQNQLSLMGDEIENWASGDFSSFWEDLVDPHGLVIVPELDTAHAKTSLDTLMERINSGSAEVNINGNTNPAGFALRQIMDEIAQGKESILIDGEPMPAEQALEYVKGLITDSAMPVTIDGDTMPAGEALELLLGRIETTDSRVMIGADVGEAQTQLTAVQEDINSAMGTIAVNGNAMPAHEALGAVLAAIDSGQGVVHINGEPMQAQLALESVVGQIDAGAGTVQINGQSVPAGQALAALVQSINTAQGTSTINGQPTPAYNALNGFLTTGNRSVTTPSVHGNVDPLNRAVSGAIAYWNGRAINVNIGGSRVTAGGGLFGYAGGGITPNFSGAPRSSRTSGMVIPGFAPGIDDVPIVASRGEAVLVPELVRRIGGRRILAANAEASGGRPATIAGAVAGMMDGTIDRNGARMAGGGMVGASHSYYSSIATMAGGGMVEQALAGTVARSAVSAAVGTARGITASHGDAIVARLDALGSEVRGLRADSAKGNYGSAQLAALRSLAGALQQTRRDVPAAADAQAGLSRSVTGAW